MLSVNDYPNSSPLLFNTVIGLHTVDTDKINVPVSQYPNDLLTRRNETMTATSKPY